MSIKVTELTFLEHFAKKYGIPVPRYIDGTASVSELKMTFKEWNDKAIIKPDVLTGKRGKAGAIVSVERIQDVIIQIKRISSTEVNGKMPRTAYLVEKIPCIFEVFSAITYDTRYLSPSFTLSLEGGVDIESVSDDKKATIPVDIFRGLDAYQVSEVLEKLGCKKKYVSVISRTMVSFWDMFIATGMKTAEINPWRFTPDGKLIACDFKATLDETNFRFKNLDIEFPDYPENTSSFEDEMALLSASSYQGQAHISELEGKKILPILFGGGASTIIIETLEIMGGEPMFLSDFGGNPTHERMYDVAKLCFEHKMKDAKLLLILGGKANNTFIDVTFQAIGDALIDYVMKNGPIDIPVVIGRGGPRLVKGMISIKKVLDQLNLPYVIFGPDTPVTLVAEYAAKLCNAAIEKGDQ